MRRRLASLIASCLVVGLIGVSFALQATAESSPPPPPPGHNHASPQPLKIVAKADPPHGTLSSTSIHSQGGGTTITCTPNVQNPHASSHVPGTMNVVATLNCDAIVPWMCVRVALWSDNNQTYVADSTCIVYQGEAWGYANAATTWCANGWYIGWGYFDVIFPPNYIPNEASSSGFGNWAYITCPTS